MKKPLRTKIMDLIFKATDNPVIDPKKKRAGQEPSSFALAIRKGKLVFIWTVCLDSKDKKLYEVKRNKLGYTSKEWDGMFSAVLDNMDLLTGVL